MFLHYGDLTDSSNLCHIVSQVKPDEIYNLAAQSHVKVRTPGSCVNSTPPWPAAAVVLTSGLWHATRLRVQRPQVSFEMSEYTSDVDGLGTLRLLNAIRTCGLEKKTRFYQASTSELYGKVQEVPQTETTPFYPRSPYAVAKQYAYWICKNYREGYNMFLCNGILFNHESPRRGTRTSSNMPSSFTSSLAFPNQPTPPRASPAAGPTFVTRKITRAVARIHKGLQKCVYLGNMNSKRDWGHARDYVEVGGRSVRWGWLGELASPAVPFRSAGHVAHSASR